MVYGDKIRPHFRRVARHQLLDVLRVDLRALADEPLADDVGTV